MLQKIILARKSANLLRVSLWTRFHAKKPSSMQENYYSKKKKNKLTKVFVFPKFIQLHHFM